ncbi:hypothetical protein BDK51DRAFT_36971 [Blyttiomyces helicus]|uniref:Uncharacterized protein n=1 Tax=Blyttiomyces helicus TaxID=388810 RepID=A0A4P9VZI9_9FUNG|nr:hypothetical protein BDK51DRAFT_36971 [Blyttiomyces helicus]|eukprot:RKO84415.1 hypothetical protein BDK51DRAFT_36971 [Blyttiomyces helicus]
MPDHNKTIRSSHGKPQLTQVKPRGGTAQRPAELFRFFAPGESTRKPSQPMTDPNADNQTRTSQSRRDLTSTKKVGPSRSVDYRLSERDTELEGRQSLSPDFGDMIQRMSPQDPRLRLIPAGDHPYGRAQAVPSLPIPPLLVTNPVGGSREFERGQDLCLAPCGKQLLAVRGCLTLCWSLEMLQKALPARNVCCDGSTGLPSALVTVVMWGARKQRRRHAQVRAASACRV